MSNIIPLPDNGFGKRIRARNVLAKLINSTGCQDEISQKIAKLIELMDKNNRKIIKIKTYQ